MCSVRSNNDMLQVLKSFFFLQQRNIKQKFIALLKKFKVSEDVSIN